MEQNQIITVRRDRTPFNNQFYCKLTDRLDEFRVDLEQLDPDFKDVMRTYMMPPELSYHKFLIPIRVPGATRGHIEVIPSNNCWKVVKVALYEDTAISGISKIGCYKPNVIDILSEFEGIQIDFGKFNPNTLISGGKTWALLQM